MLIISKLSHFLIVTVRALYSADMGWAGALLVVLAKFSHFSNLNFLHTLKICAALERGRHNFVPFALLQCASDRILLDCFRDSFRKTDVGCILLLSLYI